MYQIFNKHFPFYWCNIVIWSPSFPGPGWHQEKHRALCPQSAASGAARRGQQSVPGRGEESGAPSGHSGHEGTGHAASVIFILEFTIKTVSRGSTP